MADAPEYVMNEHGFMQAIPVEAIGMMSPCQCSCGSVFDLGMVEVIARYADASVFKTPCCGKTADDRSWVRQPYRKLR